MLIMGNIAYLSVGQTVQARDALERAARLGRSGDGQASSVAGGLLKKTRVDTRYGAALRGHICLVWLLVFRMSGSCLFFSPLILLGAEFCNKTSGSNPGYLISNKPLDARQHLLLRCPRKGKRVQLLFLIDYLSTY